MSDYMIITLKNNINCVVIDIIKKEKKNYFLISRIENEEIDNSYIICEYDEVNNCLKKVNNQEDLQILFNRRLNNKKYISYFEELKKEMIKLQVLDINSDLYLLRDEFDNLRKKNIIFINKEIKINDYIYLSEKVIKEDNIFTYGYIYNFNQININEIVIIESKDNLIVLQRYYG